MYMKVKGAISNLSFGHPYTKTTYSSYLLRKAGGGYDIFMPYVWNHVCITFKKKQESRVVLVSLCTKENRDTFPL
jgi:hypothetical protein